MKFLCEPSRLTGSVEIPGSKSHTIRAVAFASMANGTSEIRSPLDSEDAQASVRAFRALGAEIQLTQERWTVAGVGGVPRIPDNVIDVANSGTTLRIALGCASLLREGAAVFTGDHQIRRRPAGALSASLCDLGASVCSTRRNGCAPLIVEGTLRGGETTIECVTSQFLTSLLVCTPLAEQDTRIHVPLLNEAPYVGMTLDWVRRLGIQLEHAEDLSEFTIPGGQSYPELKCRIPGDFSSATFFLAAGALGNNDILCRGLDMTDTQGDKAVVSYLADMGARVELAEDGIRICGNGLKGVEIDLNATPDALPMLAALACFAEGETRLVNVPQARIKETDRIAVMHSELSKMGANVEELPDGIIVRRSDLRGADVESHDDHRIAMALAIAATQARGNTTIHNAEAVSVTYPGFAEALANLGGRITLA